MFLKEKKKKEDKAFPIQFLQALPVQLPLDLHSILASHHHHSVDLQIKVCYEPTQNASTHCTTIILHILAQVALNKISYFVLANKCLNANITFNTHLMF